jgi:hypothetical protein
MSGKRIKLKICESQRANKEQQEIPQKRTSKDKTNNNNNKTI